MRFHRARVLDSSTLTPVRAETRSNQRDLKEQASLVKLKHEIFSKSEVCFLWVRKVSAFIA
ncbi:hypothetical protein LguiB_027737 [Lonicera macranthoides]